MKLDFLRFFRFWVPAIIWAIVIFSFSSVSVPSVSQQFWTDFVAKKIAHFIEYAIFGTLFYRAFINSGVEKKRAVIYTVIISFLYAMSDEFHQEFTPKRHPRIYDVVIDTISASLAAFFLWKLLPKVPPRLRTWAERLQLT